MVAWEKRFSSAGAFPGELPEAAVCDLGCAAEGQGCRWRGGRHFSAWNELVKHDPSAYLELWLEACSEVRLGRGQAARSPQDNTSPAMLAPLPNSEGPQAGQEFKSFLTFTPKNDHYIRFTP